MPIKYPHSLIHEYGHLIDYEYGRLSHEFAFYHIRKLYEQHLSRLSVEDSVVSEKLNGKTKYNLSYYQEPTEIFARSFELYVSKCLGVKNSLLPLDFGWEYPCDEKFIEAVKFYFDNIFANIAIQKSLAA